MPLSKQRNRHRMRLIRRNKRSLSPQKRDYVQPRPLGFVKDGTYYQKIVIPQIDADGNVIPEE